MLCTCRYLVVTGCVLGAVILACQNPEENEPPHSIPADAGYVQIARINDTIRVSGRGPSDAEIVMYEWAFGDNAFMASSTGDTFVIAPAVEDSAYPCILRVTDVQGNTGLDTTFVWVVEDPFAAPFRILSPDGGEVFRAGDSVAVELWPVNRDAGIRLVIGDNIFQIKGFNNTFKPAVMPGFKFKISDTYSYPQWDPATQDLLTITISPVSDSCKFRIYNYFNENEYAESADYFCIVPGG